MELVYCPEYSLSNGSTQGILIKCNPQEYNQIDTINLLEEIRFEYAQSNDINVSLSTDNALIERGIMLSNEQGLMQTQIDQAEWKVNQWDTIVQRRKDLEQDFSRNNDNDYKEYLSWTQQMMRNEQVIEFWNAAYEYDKAMVLSLEIKEELLNRKLEALVKEGYAIQKYFADQSDQLLQQYQIQVSNMPFFGIAANQTIHMTDLLKEEFQKNLLELKNNVTENLNKKQQIYSKIENEIKKIGKQIEYFNKEATEEYDQLMGINDEILKLEEYPTEETDSEYLYSETESL
jgi:hypothetical protein